jgi:hypothetical protein
LEGREGGRESARELKANKLEGKRKGGRDWFVFMRERRSQLIVCAAAG